MNKISSTLLACIVISLITCKSADVNPSNYQKVSIIFGDGGGFSGFINTYCILDNGMTFKKMHQDTGFIYVSKMDVEQARQMINNYSALGFDQMTLNQPGNAYHFLEFGQGEEKNKIVWDPHKMEEYKSINDYYRTIRTLFFENQKLTK